MGISRMTYLTDIQTVQGLLSDEYATSLKSRACLSVCLPVVDVPVPPTPWKGG